MMEPIILFVDDELAILRSIKRIFHRSSRIILSGNNDQTATIASINQGRIFKFLTKPFDKDSLRAEIDLAIAEWHSRVYSDVEKRILKQTSLVQLIDKYQSQDDFVDAIAVVFAIREFDLLKAQLGNFKTNELLLNIAPSHATRDDGITIALLDEGHYCSFIKIARPGVDHQAVISALLDMFESNPIVDGRKHSVAFDIGYAVAQATDVDGAALVENAKTALNAAREGQMRRIVMFDAQLTSNRGRLLALESGLRTALGENEFVLFYQPKIDIAKQTLHGAEALIRWNSGVLGQVSPFEFIPLTEKNGMIDDIGEWVMNEAARQWRCWFPNIESGPAVSVNVSSVQLKNTDFIHNLERTLVQHDIPPSLLELEITESLMVDDMNGVIEILNQIKNLGVKLSIDDFGTGYSSLSYLSRLPVDTIKIDRSFIMPMLESDEKLAMVRNLIRLGHDMGMQLVAEGVEAIDQLLVLKELGCDITQGYYFSPPVAADEFIGKSSDIMNAHMHPANLQSVGSA